MIEIKLSFASVDEAIAFLSRDKAQGPAVGAVEASLPARKPRTPKATPAVVEVTAESLFGGAPAQQAPAPVEQPKPKATQAHLINAFRNLANAKGTDPIVALLGEYKSKSVAAIPEAVWPSAIEAAAQRAGLTYAAAIEAPAK